MAGEIMLARRVAAAALAALGWHHRERLPREYED
jgi:hypothetical protein